MSQITIFSGAERRRRWSERQKRALVDASLVPGASVVQIAREADITPSLIYKWRRLFGVKALERPTGFAAVSVSQDGLHDRVSAVMVIEVGRVTVRVGASAPLSLVTATLRELSR